MFTTHWCIYVYFKLCDEKRKLWRSFCFPILPPWWFGEFFCIQNCVVSFQWIRCIQLFPLEGGDHLLRSSKTVSWFPRKKSLGGWDLFGHHRSTVDHRETDLLWTWRTWYQHVFFNENSIHVKLKRFFEALSDQFSKKTGMMSSWGLLRCFFEMLIATSTGAMLPFLYILFWWGIEWSILYI